MLMARYIPLSLELSILAPTSPSDLVDAGHIFSNKEDIETIAVVAAGMLGDCSLCIKRSRWLSGIGSCKLRRQLVVYLKASQLRSDNDYIELIINMYKCKINPS
jgi:hypothetical protein